MTKFIIINSKYYSTWLIINAEEDRSHVTKFITDMGDFLQSAYEQVKTLGDAQVRVCVCVCVCEREGAREYACLCVCMCVCVWERERESMPVCVCAPYN